MHPYHSVGLSRKTWIEVVSFSFFVSFVVVAVVVERLQLLNVIFYDYFPFISNLRGLQLFFATFFLLHNVAYLVFLIYDATEHPFGQVIILLS